jgi:hypothetical protein
VLVCLAVEKEQERVSVLFAEKRKAAGEELKRTNLDLPWSA